MKRGETDRPARSARDVIELIAAVAAAFLLFYALYRVGQLIDAGSITGESGMVLYVTVAAGAGGYLFGAGLTKANQRSALEAYDAGVRTPGPNDTGAPNTVIRAETANVQGGNPTNVVESKAEET